MSARPSWLAIRDRFSLVAAAFACAFISGLAIARGGRLSVVVLGAAALGALAIPFSQLRHRALWVWLVAMPIAYPFVRFPHGKSIVSFDRVWVGGMVLVVLLTTPHGVRRSRAGNLMLGSLASLLVVFGLRAVLTPSSTVAEIELWIDAVCVPVGLFVVTRAVVSSTARLRQLMGFVTVAGVIIAVIGLAETVVGFQLATYSGGQARYDAAINLVRVAGPFSAPEPYALALLGTLAATLTWVRLRRVPVWLTTALVVVQAAAIATSYFRSAWLGLAIVLIGGASAATKQRAKRYVLIGAAIVLAYGVVATLARDSSVVGTRISNVANIYGRLAAFRQGADMFAAHPVFGVGVGQYTNVAQNAPPVTVNGYASVPDPHNSFVAMLAEQGVIGFVALLAVTVAAWLLIRALRRGARDPVDLVLGRNVACAGIGFLIMSLTLTMITYEPSNAIFAVLLGAVAARVDARAGPARYSASARLGQARA